MCCLRRMISGVLAVIALAGESLSAQQADTLRGERTVMIDGHAVRVQVLGLENRREGAPVVVFEAGATNSLNVWGGIVQSVADIAPVVAYDRAGLGRSEWDGATPTPRHVASRLRRVLQQIRAEPPYLLVGYSWGGILARYFAGYHPDEVVGLVLLDPSPMITQSLADNLAPFSAVGAGQKGFDAYWSGFARLFEHSAPGVRAEFDVFHGLMRAEVADRDLRPVPDVPLVVIVAARYLPLPGMQLPFDPRAHFRADLRHRIRIVEEWILASSKGTLVMSNHTTHAVPREDPELVVWAVQRVLSAASNGP